MKTADISWMNSKSVDFNKYPAFLTFGDCVSLNRLIVGEKWNPYITLKKLSLDAMAEPPGGAPVAWNWRTASKSSVGNGDMLIRDTYYKKELYYTIDDSDTLKLSPVETANIHANGTKALTADFDTEIPWSGGSFNKVEFVPYTWDDGTILKVTPSSMINWFSGKTLFTGFEYTTNKVDTSSLKSIDNMFKDCTGLTELDISWMNTSNVPLPSPAGNSMFEGCDSLTSVIFGDKWNHNMTLNDIALNGTWKNSKQNPVPPNVGIIADTYTKVEFYYWYDEASTTLKFSPTKLNDDYSDGASALSASTEYDVPWLSNSTGATKVVYVAPTLKSGKSSLSSDMNIYPSSMNYWFKGFSNLTDISGLESIDTSMLTSIEHTFDGCSALTVVDLSWMNTKNVYVPSLDYEMFTFKDCTSMTSFKVSEDWNKNLTFNVLGIPGEWKTSDGNKYDKDSQVEPNNDYLRIVMYWNLTGGDTLSLSPTKLDGYQDGSSALQPKSLDDIPWLKSYDKSIVKVEVRTSNGDEKIQPYSMWCWFRNCVKLTDIAGLSSTNFDTSKLSSIYHTFTGCTSLELADLSWMNTTGVSAISSLQKSFEGCTKLRKLIIGENWNEDITLVRLGIDGSWFCLDYPEFTIDSKLKKGTYTKATLYWGDEAIDDNSNYRLFLSAVPCDKANIDATKALSSYNHYDVAWNVNENRGLYSTVEILNYEEYPVMPASMSYWFSNFESLDNVVFLNYIDYSRLNDVYEMFYGCKSLKDLDLSPMNIKNCDPYPEGRANCMLLECTELTKIKLGDNWNPSFTMKSTGLSGKWMKEGEESPYDKDALWVAGTYVPYEDDMLNAGPGHPAQKPVSLMGFSKSSASLINSACKVNVYDVDDNKLSDDNNWFKDFTGNNVWVCIENASNKAFEEKVYASVTYADGTVANTYIPADKMVNIKAKDQTVVCKWALPGDMTNVVDIQFMIGNIPSEVAADAAAGDAPVAGTPIEQSAPAESNAIDGRMGGSAPSTNFRGTETQDANVFDLQ